MANGESQAQARRRAYLFALPLTVVAVVLTYLAELNQAVADPFNLVALPLLALLLGILALGHALRVFALPWVERGFFAVAALAYFGKLGFTLLTPYAPLDRAHELGQVYIWTPFIYALAFLAGTPRASRYRAIGAYLASVGVGLAAALTGTPLGNYRLPEYYLGNLVLLALLGLVGGLRARIGELQTDLSETTRLATLDFLTGVPNRRLLEAYLLRDIELYRLYGTPVAVILFDIDHFKVFNDTHGHARGDAVLKAVAVAVQQELRPTDAFGRWGGEEFLVVAAQTDARHALRLAERLRRLVEAGMVGDEHPVTASFGVAVYRGDSGLEGLVARADAALYRAKTRGRNRVAFDRPRGLPAGTELPRLVYPFPEVLKSPSGEVVAAVSAWLAAFELGPAPADLRGHMAHGFANLAVTLHPYAPRDWQVLLGRWYCWAFLHDDRCDESDLGRQPERLKVLTDRLARLFAGATVRREDERLGRALAGLRRDLLEAGGAPWFRALRRELGGYFAALHWEAHNRAAGVTPSLDRYLAMRPVTVGLRIDDLFRRADGVVLPRTVGAGARVLTLTRLANEVVCWANDLVSLDKELRQGDVHNLVRVLEQAHRYSLPIAIEQAKRQHDRTLAGYLEAEQQVQAQFGDAPGMATYLELLRARMRGIHDWALVSGRYRPHEVAELPNPQA